MGTAATATLIAGPGAVGDETFEGVFTVLLDTTDGSGLMTLDLTTWYSCAASISIAGSLAVTGYVVEVQKPAYTTALDATNVVLAFYEAGADGAVLDLVAANDFSAVITGLTIVVKGKQAV